MRRLQVSQHSLFPSRLSTKSFRLLYNLQFYLQKYTILLWLLLLRWLVHNYRTLCVWEANLHIFKESFVLFRQLFRWFYLNWTSNSFSPIYSMLYNQFLFHVLTFYIIYREIKLWNLISIVFCLHNNFSSVTYIQKEEKQVRVSSAVLLPLRPFSNTTRNYSLFQWNL